MASIDKRVVEMKFDNAAFERGVSTTMSTLDKFKGFLSRIGDTAKNLGAINIKTNTQGLEPLSKGVDSLVTKFSALQVAGVTAIANIANKAVNAGLNMTKSLTIAPISGGLGEYEKKLGSIQTILANTESAGTNLKQVSGALNELNLYSDKTIYNFGEMARNIGTFTAAGVDLKTATASIKGIANLAALSGSNSQQASTAMYQLSQAISAGRVSLMDWNSVVNAGMGGSVFQRSLAETAVAMGKLPKSALKLEGAMKNVKINGESFRQSISAEGKPSWLTSDVLTTALNNFTGDMKEADLVAQGFSKSQAAAIMAQAKTASDAATMVKTGSQLMSTLRESAESGWAETWEFIVGDFTEAPKLWTGISDAIGGVIQASAQARNHMLHQWQSLGGRTAIIDSFRNAWQGLGSVLKPIGDAYRSVFPSGGMGQALADFSFKLREITSHMKVGKETAELLKRTFQGVFSIFKIGLTILGGAAKGIFKIFGILGSGAGGSASSLLELTAAAGDFLVKIQEWLTKTGGIKTFFDVLTSPLKLLKPGIDIMVALAHAFTSLLAGDVSGFTSRLSGVGDAFRDMFGGVLDRYRDFANLLGDGLAKIEAFFGRLSSMALNSGNAFIAGVAGVISSVAGKISDFAENVGAGLSRVISMITGATAEGRTFFSGFGSGALENVMGLVSKAGDLFANLRSKLNFSGVFDSFNNGAKATADGGGKALSSTGDAVSKVWSSISGIASGIGRVLSTVASAIGGFFSSLAGKIKSYISDLDMTDVIAILNTGMLFMIVKAFRDVTKDIGQAFNNIGGSFGQLTSTLKTMQTSVQTTIVMQIAIAVGILVAAMFTLAKIDAGALKTALVAVGALFAEIAAMMYILKKIDPSSMVGAGISMVALATALLILSRAVKVLGEMDPAVLIQGGIAIAAIMAAMAGMAKLMTFAPGIFTTAAALLVLAAAMTAIAGAIALYAAIPIEVLKKGILSMGAALLALGIAMQAFPKGMVLKAAGITILAAALVVLTGAIAALGILPLHVIVKGILSMGAALLILALAAHAMNGAAAGAAAMMLMAAAIAVLAPALALLGALPLEVIGKGLLAIAGLMVIFVAGMYLLAPVIVVLSLFSAAIMTLGLAMLAAGAGFALFVGALAALTVVGAAGFAVLTAGIIAIIGLLPLMAQQLGYALITIANVIGKAAPKLAEAAGTIAMAFINEFARRIPELAETGLKMIEGLLTAIRDHIDNITNLAIDIVVVFIDTLNGRLPKIIQAGVDFIISFVEGLAEAIRGNRQRTGEAGADLAKAMVEGLISGLSALGSMLGNAIRNLANSIINWFRDHMGIHSPSTVFTDFGKNIVMGLVNGILGLVGFLRDGVLTLVRLIISTFKNGILNIANLGMDIVKFLANGIINGAQFLYTTASNLIKNMITWFKNGIGSLGDIGLDIVRGLANGIANSAHLVKDAAVNLAKKLPGWMKKVLGIESPSKEFAKIGVFINEGLVKGLTGSRDQVQAAFDRMKGDIRSAKESAAKDITDLNAKIKKLNGELIADDKAIAAQRKALRDAESRDMAASANGKKATAAQEKAFNESKAKAVQDAKDKLEKLIDARNRDAAAISAARTALAQANDEYSRSSNAYHSMTTAMGANVRQLQNLADQVDANKTKIEEANKALDDAIKTRDDYKKSVTDSFDALPDINKDTTLADYVESLQAKKETVVEFNLALEQLRQYGLSDQMYQEFLKKGVDSLPFIQEVLKGGKASVDLINESSKNLATAAEALGTTAAYSMYQAGVDTAQGLLNGLKSQEEALRAEMAVIAAIIAQKAKEELKIKSPSRVMAQIGVYTIQGLVKGLKDSTALLSGAGTNVGNATVSAMRDALRRVSDAVDTNMELNPTITPVLDLSNIQKNASKLDSMLALSIGVDDSYSRAAEVSRLYRSNQTTEPSSDATGTIGETNVTFIQNNSSPKALSHAEIYRQTNNQLSVAKGALTKNAS